MGLFDLPAPLFSAFDGVLGMALPPVLRLVIWGILAGWLTMVVYRRLSNQEKIGELKAQQKVPYTGAGLQATGIGAGPGTACNYSYIVYRRLGCWRIRLRNSGCRQRSIIVRRTSNQRHPLVIDHGSQNHRRRLGSQLAG